MKRLVVILLVAALLGGLAYSISYYVARDTFCRSPQEYDKLGWLRQEFRLTDAQYAQIKQLHDGYYPQCTMMCGEVKQSRQSLAEVILTNSSLTPQVQAALQRDDEVQQKCREEMLRHFYAVSQAMSPDEGKRYLQMMQTECYPQERIMNSPDSQH